MDAVLASGGSHDVHRVPGAGCRGGNDLVRFENAHGHRIHQRIDLVARVKEDLTTHNGHTKAVAVIANAFHDAFQEPLGARVAQIAKAQAVQLRDGTRTHGENVTVDPPNASRRTPNFTEMCVYSVMWSEHCSYKNSINWLKTLPKALRPCN